MRITGSRRAKREALRAELVLALVRMADTVDRLENEIYQPGGRYHAVLTEDERRRLVGGMGAMWDVAVNDRPRLG